MMERQNETRKNAKIVEAQGLDRIPRGRAVEDPEIWFDFDNAGHRAARNIRDLAAALRVGDIAEANLCLDLIGNDHPKFADQVALGRYRNGEAKPC